MAVVLKSKRIRPLLRYSPKILSGFDTWRKKKLPKKAGSLAIRCGQIQSS
jgi:hypothetical protein